MEKTRALEGDYLACAFDAAYFMEFAFGVKPEPWQEDFLRDDESPRVQFICTRQGGKSLSCAVKALHTAIFRPNSEILIVSRRFKQAQETYRKVRTGYRRAKIFCGKKNKNTAALELANNSRILSLPGDDDNIRGYSGVTLLIIDEASRVPDSVYRAVKPMLSSSKGHLVIASTPFGQQGFFYNRYLEPQHWKQVMTTASECPRLSDEFIQEEIREHGERYVRQEYFCEFVSSSEQLFSHEIIMKAITPNLPALQLSDPRRFF